MYEEVFEKFTSQAQEFSAPARRFTSVVVDNVEKLISFQLETARSYAELGLEQLRAALEISVTDPQSVQTYVSNQAKVANTVGQKITDDAKTLAGIGQNFSSEIQKLAKENATFLADIAKPKAKPAARKTA